MKKVHMAYLISCATIGIGVIIFSSIKLLSIENTKDIKETKYDVPTQTISFGEKVKHTKNFWTDDRFKF